MIGQTISHYRIVSQLGVGGMGVVYAADDPRLNRQVALKFVPEDVGHDAHALERLRSEARTASSLNHPNICTIYDIGEHNGRPFIVMELLKGITLRDRLLARPLKIHETVDIGIQVSDALFWAHSKDVIHRDIKPANLFLVDHGQLKVLDFGLAKLTTPGPGSEATVAPTIDLTAVGVAVGTVSYMSPEQVSGETLDRRTDLFSLGVVLYECVTGQQPFKGKTSAVVLASILTQTPIAPVVLNNDVPPRLQEVINNCLEKDRELRYQDAAGLRTDLRRIKRDLESGALKTLSARSVAAAHLSGSVPSVPDPPAPPESSASKAREAIAATTPGTPGTSKGMLIGAGAAAVVAGGVALAIMMNGRQSPAPAPEPTITTAPPPVSAAAPPSAPVDQARAQFDAAIVETNRLLAAGDADGATRALNAARAIDPGAPVVAELSSRLVERFRAEPGGQRATQPPTPAQPARRTPATEPPAAARATPPVAAPPMPPANPAPVVAQRPAETPAVAVPPPSPVPPAAAVAPPPPVAAPQTVAAEPAPAAIPPAPRTEAAPERRGQPPPSPAAEDDDAIIRRVLANYARAIETKDLALFRSVKPNMSSDEQRRIEEGFRAVTSQRVNLTILSIEHRGTEASVRLRRQDVIQAGGRQQSADSQQTVTLVKNGTGWVIREIGR